MLSCFAKEGKVGGRKKGRSTYLSKYVQNYLWTRGHWDQWCGGKKCVAEVEACRVAFCLLIFELCHLL